MSFLIVENLRKEFGSNAVLKGVNAVVERGDIISIIGPSGSGKSTFLRCLNRLEDATSGRVIFDGQLITDRKCNIAEVRRKIGLVYQTFSLFENLNVIENITAAPRALLKMSKGQTYNEGMQLLSRVGLWNMADKFPEELSGGEQQRVAIARAIAMKPEIMLFDDPTSGLEPMMKEDVLSVIRSLAAEGTTMLIATNEMKFAQEISNRIFYMDDGWICEEGTPDEIFTNPQKDKTRRFVRQLRTLSLIIDSPTFNFLAYRIRIEDFAKSALAEEKELNYINLVFEELVMQSLIPHLYRNAYPILVTAKISGEEKLIEIRIEYRGDRYDPFMNLDNLSIKIVRNIASRMDYYYDGTNHVHVSL